MRALCLGAACLYLFLGACEATPACEAAPEGRLVTLIDHEAWRVAELDEDPWRAHRPEDITCPERAREPEEFAGLMTFGIESGACPYTTIIQPTRTVICEGEQLYVWLWRYALTSPSGGTATMGAAIDGQIVWEQEVPIPSPSAMVALPVALPRGLPIGVPVAFHVRNHGDNAYQLLDLARCRGTCEP